ncbi:hypothetical protein ACYF6T_42850 [Streptomyces sp. 7R007]
MSRRRELGEFFTVETTILSFALVAVLTLLLIHVVRSAPRVVPKGAEKRHPVLGALALALLACAAVALVVGTAVSDRHGRRQEDQPVVPPTQASFLAHYLPCRARFGLVASRPGMTRRPCP